MIELEAMNENKEHQQLKKIDIRKLFQEKNPKLAPYIPGFIYAWLKRILHLEFVNSFIEKHGDKRDLEFAEATIKEFNISTEVIGWEHLPENGRVIFVANHPLGGFDGMVLIHLIGRKYPGVKTLSNDILMSIKNMNGIFVPINKHGRQAQETVKEFDRVFAGDDPVMSFPSGFVSRRKRGVIMDLEWKKNFVTKSKQYKRDVVPVWISGRCTNFFYNLSNIRKFLGIKANLEMFYLPDETYRHRNEHIKIVFGKAIPWETFSSDKRPADWAEIMKNLVYRLKDDPEAKLELDI